MDGAVESASGYEAGGFGIESHSARAFHISHYISVLNYYVKENTFCVISEDVICGFEWDFHCNSGEIFNYNWGILTFYN